MWRFRVNNPNTYKDESSYEQMKKRRKITFIALPVTFVSVFVFAYMQGEVNIQEKAKSYTGEDKSTFDQKFAEYSKNMNESDARKEAVRFTDKMKKENKRINSLEGEDKEFWIAKFNEYKTSMDEADAKIAALKDLDAEIEKRNKELQKKFDDQKQYEEWIAWQKSEEEKKKTEEQKIAEEKERQELQKKYDDQKKYEEWIAWQKSEDDKKLAAEARERQKKEEERQRLEAEKNKYSPVNVDAMYNAFKGKAFNLLNR